MAFRLLTDGRNRRIPGVAPSPRRAPGEMASWVWNTLAQSEPRPTPGSAVTGPATRGNSSMVRIGDPDMRIGWHPRYGALPGAFCSGSTLHLKTDGFELNDWAIEVIATVLVDPSSGDQPILTMAETPGNATLDRSLYADSATGSFRTYLFDGTAENLDASTQVKVGRAYHLVYTALGSPAGAGDRRHSLYVDGELEATATGITNGGFAGYSSPELIFGYGQEGSPGRAGNTLISFVRLYDRFLDPATVRSRYQDPWKYHRAPSKQIFFVEAAAGGPSTFNKTSSDSFALAPAASELADFVASIADALTFGDTSSETIGGVQKAAADAITFADASSEVATFARTVLDAISFSDSAEIATKVLGLLCTQTLTLADACSAEGGVQIATQRGGSSLTLEKMRRLERLQMLHRDDEEIVNLIMGLLK